MNTGATPVLNTAATQTFEMPQGWTVRKVATALAREWLAPLRPDVVVKSAKWIVQPVVAEPADGLPLWEEGISTADYEQRMERSDLSWSVQARAGRNKSLLLARLNINPNRPMTFDLVCPRDAVPETLIDPAKLAPFLAAHGGAGVEGLFAGLLLDHGFRIVSPH